MADLTAALKNAQLWPIQLQGKINRLGDKALGDPKIEYYYHKSLEEGRKLEKSIADANNLLLTKKQGLVEKISQYFQMNQLAVDGQLGHLPRVPKYIVDSSNILREVSKFQSDITGLISAVTTNIGILSAMAQNTFQMVQANLNAIANLMNNVCNFGLPDIPAIPNMFSDTVWHWNGFQFFPLAAFALKLEFDFNFAFNMCQLHAPNIDIFRNYPSSVDTYGGLTYGTPFFVPPLDGIGIPNTGQNLSDPNFISLMQATNTDPYFLPPTADVSTLPPGSTVQVFNPNSSMFGSVPDAHTVINNYLMPPTTYTDNIVAVTPVLRSNVVLPGAPDYASPDLTVRNPQLRKSLIHFINLAQVTSNNYDPYLLSAWLLYLGAARAGRSGLWLRNFQAVYDQYIAPSIEKLQTVSVPWNNVLGSINSLYMSIWDPTLGYFPGDVVSFGDVLWTATQQSVALSPASNPDYWVRTNTDPSYTNAPVVVLAAVLKALAPAAQATLLWKLSYVEAGLLGYSRNQTWDFAQDPAYVSDTTGTDLDYTPTTVTLGSNATEVLGVGTAEFPVPVTFPSAIKAVLDSVISQASADIEADVSYQSPKLGNRYQYNQFAVASPVDRFSQFWRDFATALTNLLAQGPYLVQFAVTYFGTLNGAVNPLGDPAPYRLLVLDASSRTRSWTPGTPLLKIPVAPNVTFLNVLGATAPSGWTDPPTGFDSAAFLARPDIHGLPITVQTAMLRMNLAYAQINQFKADYIAEINTQLATAQANILANQQVGFHVTDYASVTAVPSATAVNASFDPILPDSAVDYDFTGNTSNLPPGTFTIQASGSYAGSGQINSGPVPVLA